MVVVGGRRTILNLVFLDQAMRVLPEEAFTKSREILTQMLVSYQKYLPAQGLPPSYGRQIQQPCLLTYCQKGPLVVWGSLCFLPPRSPGPSQWDCVFTSRMEGALCDLAMYFPVALRWLLWGCSTHHPQSVTPTPICHLPHLGSRVLFHHWCPACGLSSDSASRDSPSGPHLCSLQLPPGSSSPSPIDCSTGNFFGAEKKKKFQYWFTYESYRIFWVWKIFFCWSTIDTQCYTSFRCTTQGFDKSTCYALLPRSIAAVCHHPTLPCQHWLYSLGHTPSITGIPLTFSHSAHLPHSQLLENI